MADHTPEELKAKFWKALRSDMTVMLGLAKEDVEARPMAAQLEDEDRGPIWFFAAKENDLVRGLQGPTAASFQFASKGHDIWANVAGTLQTDMNRAKVDELWNTYVAAWYPGGKDDPSLALLRFDPDHAKIWLDANSLVEGIKMLLGADPKEDVKDKVAEVRL